jgi:hypothetical protein
MDMERRGDTNDEKEQLWSEFAEMCTVENDYGIVSWKPGVPDDVKNNRDAQVLFTLISNSAKRLSEFILYYPKKYIVLKRKGTISYSSYYKDDTFDRAFVFAYKSLVDMRNPREHMLMKPRMNSTKFDDASIKEMLTDIEDGIRRHNELAKRGGSPIAAIPAPPKGYFEKERGGSEAPSGPASDSSPSLSRSSSASSSRAASPPIPLDTQLSQAAFTPLQRQGPISQQRGVGLESGTPSAFLPTSAGSKGDVTDKYKLPHLETGQWDIPPSNLPSELEDMRLNLDRSLVNIRAAEQSIAQKKSLIESLNIQRQSDISRLRQQKESVLQPIRQKIERINKAYTEAHISLQQQTQILDKQIADKHMEYENQIQEHKNNILQLNRDIQFMKQKHAPILEKYRKALRIHQEKQIKQDRYQAVGNLSPDGNYKPPRGLFQAARQMFRRGP